jgi:hypothetical protein
MILGDEGGPLLLAPALAFSKSHHFNWDNFPTNTMAYDNITQQLPFILQNYIKREWH